VKRNSSVIPTYPAYQNTNFFSPLLSDRQVRHRHRARLRERLADRHSHRRRAHHRPDRHRRHRQRFFQRCADLHPVCQGRLLQLDLVWQLDYRRQEELQVRQHSQPCCLLDGRQKKMMRGIENWSGKVSWGRGNSERFVEGEVWICRFFCFICIHFSAWIQRELSLLPYLVFGGDQGKRSLWSTDPSKHKGGYVYVCMCECKARH
jgi:hypothetical protein